MDRVTGRVRAHQLVTVLLTVAAWEIAARRGSLAEPGAASPWSQSVRPCSAGPRPAPSSAAAVWAAVRAMRLVLKMTVTPARRISRKAVTAPGIGRTALAPVSSHRFQRSWS